MKINVTAVVCGAALLMQASVGAAQRRNADEIVGSDTFDAIMKDLFEVSLVTDPAGGGVAGGIGITENQYLGLGSSTGERQMEGASSGGDAVKCDSTTGPNDDQGCQEIAPMSREMDSSICDDAESTFAEGLGVCEDGLVVFSDNASMQGDTGVSASACADWTAGGFAASQNDDGNDFVDFLGGFGVAGALPNTGYDVGGGAFSASVDALRVIYTGCKNDEGDCVDSIDRLTRCGDPVRDELVSTWDNMVAGADCAAGVTCPNGLRRAYRRDDNSGTTGVFLRFLGVSANLAPRAKLVSDSFDCFLDPNLCCGDGTIQIASIPGNHAFCDGGQNENYAPDCQGGTFIAHGGDPLRRPCAPEDDLCDPTGNGGLVQAVISTPATADAFASHQCTDGAFTLVSIGTTAPAGGEGICADGSNPLTDLCFMPLFNPGGVGNCMTSVESNSNVVPNSTDGRSYNTMRRDANGDIVTIGGLIETPAWRMNSFVADTDGLFGRLATGFPITAAEEVCTRASATEQIGCVTGNTTCTIGFAGREAAFQPGNPASSLINEPFKIDGVLPSNNDIGPYPFSRTLFVNAIGGFENMSADCAARGEDPAWCADQLNIANVFFNDTNGAVTQACNVAGFIPRTTPVCRGTTSSAGCGQPDSQALAACTPN